MKNKNLKVNEVLSAEINYYAKECLMPKTEVVIEKIDGEFQVTTCRSYSGNLADDYDFYDNVAFDSVTSFLEYEKENEVYEEGTKPNDIYEITLKFHDGSKILIVKDEDTDEISDEKGNVFESFIDAVKFYSK